MSSNGEDNLQFLSFLNFRDGEEKNKKGRIENEDLFEDTLDFAQILPEIGEI